MASKTVYQVTTHFINDGYHGSVTNYTTKDWVKVTKAFNRRDIKDFRPNATIIYDTVTPGTMVGDTFVAYSEQEPTQ